MNNQDIDDLKAFVYLLVQKSVDYQLKPETNNLELLKMISRNFYMCLPKKAKNLFRDNLKEILNNISLGFEKLNEMNKKIEIKQENEKPLDIYLIEKEIKSLKRGL